MVYALKDKTALTKLADMAQKNSRYFKIPRENFMKYVADAVGSPNSIVLLDEIEGNIFGFIYASVEEYNGEDVCFIQGCVIEGERKETGPKFLSVLKKWCVLKGLKKILFSCTIDDEGKSRANAYERKYGFKQTATILSMNVK